MNGGYIGKEREPNKCDAIGVWQLEEIYNARLTDEWPTLFSKIGLFIKFDFSNIGSAADVPIGRVLPKIDAQTGYPYWSNENTGEERPITLTWSETVGGAGRWVLIENMVISEMWSSEVPSFAVAPWHTGISWFNKFDFDTPLPVIVNFILENLCSSSSSSSSEPSSSSNDILLSSSSSVLSSDAPTNSDTVSSSSAINTSSSNSAEAEELRVTKMAIDLLLYRIPPQ